MTSFSVTTPPTSEPITLAQVKSHLRLTTSTDDDYLTLLIEAARDAVEIETGRALITQTITAYIDAPKARAGGIGGEWWDGVRDGPITMDQQQFIELPRPKLLTVTSFKYFSLDNSENTFASTNYFVDGSSVPGRIVLNSGSSWPIATRDKNAYEIVYTAGYGPDPTDVPALLRRAMLECVGEWYENRTSVGSDEVPSLPEDLITKVRKFSVGRL